MKKTRYPSYLYRYIPSKNQPKNNQTSTNAIGLYRECFLLVGQFTYIKSGRSGHVSIKFTAVLQIQPRLSKPFYSSGRLWCCTRHFSLRKLLSAIMYSVIQIVIVCLLTVQFAYISTVPVPENGGKPDANADESNDQQIVDQRQNGSENLRIHMNDLTLMVAPSDGFLQLMSASASDLLNTGNDLSNSNKPGGSSTYPSDCATETTAKCKHQINKK